MSSIDNRIVNMKFDNAQFERGIVTSTRALEKFDSDLNRLTASDYGGAFGSIGTAVEHIAGRFTWLGEIAQQMRERVVGAVMDIASNIIEKAKPLSYFGGAADGYKEYELKMDSVKTIMNSTGESIETVNKWLKEMDNYADDTIYSLRDMTSNIGKFTNAGMKLEEAVPVMKGIANLAAISGTNALDASRAMFNFSQAFGSGFMNRIDWKTMNTVGMDTMEFKEYVMEAAVACGTLEKNSEGMYRSLTTNAQGKQSQWFTSTEGFTDSLQHQWMSAQALKDALLDYGDVTTEIGKKGQKAAQEVRTFSKMLDALAEASGTGWSDTYSIVIGDMEEATKLWTRVNDALSGVMKASAEARNKVLSDWKEAGGRTKLIEGLATVFSSLGSVIGAVKQAWKDIFPPITGAKLVKLTEQFEDFTKKLIPSQQTLEQVNRIFRGLFSALKIITPVFIVAKLGFVGFAKILMDIVVALGLTNESVLEFLASIGDYITELASAINYSEIFKTVMAGIDKFVGLAKDKIAEMMKFIKENPLIVGIIEGIKNGARLIIDVIVDFVRTMVNKFKSLLGIASPSKVFFEMGMNMVKGLAEGLQNGIAIIAGVVYGIIKAIGQTFMMAFNETGNIFVNSLDFIKNAMSKFSAEVKSLDFSGLDSFKAKIKSVITESTFLAKIVSMFNKFIDAMKGIWAWLKKTFGPMIEYIIGKFRQITFRDIIDGGALVLVASTLMNFINSFSRTFQAFSTVMDSFSKVMESFSGIGDAFKNVLGGVTSSLTALQDAVKDGIKSVLIRSIAVSVAILTASLLVLSLLKWDSLQRGLAGLAGATVSLVAAMQGMRGVTFGGTGKIVAIGIALMLISASLAKLSRAGQDISPALGALALLMALLVVFTRLAGGKDIMIGSMQLISLGIGMRLLAGGIAAMASAPWQGLLAGMVALSGTLGALIAFVKFADPISFFIMAKGMISMAAGLWIISSAVARFGSLDLDIFRVGIIRIAASLILLGVSARTFPITGAPKLIGFAMALASLMIPIKLFSTMDAETFVLGIAKIFGSLWVIGKALKSFRRKNVIGLLSIAAALTLLTIPIKILGAMDSGSIVQGILAIGGALVSLGVGMGVMNFALDWFGNQSLGIVKIALALVMLAIPIKILGAMSLPDIFQGVIALGAALIALGVGMAALSTTGGGDMVKIGGALIVVAFALTAMLIPLTALGLLPTKVIVPGITALVFMLAALSAALHFMPNAETITALGGSILKLTVGIGLLAGVVLLLSIINYQYLGVGLAAFGAGLWMVVKFTQTLPPNLDKIAMKLVLLGAAILLLVAGVKILGELKGPDLVVGVLGLVAVLFIAGLAIEIFKEKAKEVAGASLALITLGVAMLGLYLPIKLIGALPWYEVLIAIGALAIAIVGLCKGAFALSAAAMPMLMFGEALIVVSIGAYLLGLALEKFISIAETVGGWVVSALEWMGLKSKPAEAGSLTNYVDEETKGMKSAMENNLKVEEWRRQGADSMEGLGKGINDKRPYLQSMAANAGGEIENQFGKSLRPEMYRQNGIEAATAVGEGVEDGTLSMFKNLSNLGFFNNDELKGLLNFDQSAGTLHDLGNNMMAGENGAFGGLMSGQSDMMKKFNESPFDISKIMGDSNNIGEIKDVYENFLNGQDGALGGMQAGGKDILANAKQLGVDVDKSFKENLKPDQMKDNVQAYLSGAESGIDDMKIKLPQKLGEVGATVVGAAEESMSEEKFEPVGDNIVSGVISGIDKNSDKLMDRVKKLANDAVDAAKKTLDSDSPSKVFAEIGADVDNGFALGIANNMQPVISAVEGVGHGATNSMQQALSNINVSDMNMDVRPTITPVLDLSSVQKDAKKIPNMLNGGVFSSKISAGNIQAQMTKRSSSFGQMSGPQSNVYNDQSSVTMQNTFNVKNENDARQISNKLGAFMSRYNAGRGRVVAAR
jgi:hypothetical protein